jgi:hypothetical protein
MDDAAADWVETMFHSGAQLNTVRGWRAEGLHYFLPVTKWRLHLSWKLFGIWRKVEVPSRAPPITDDLYSMGNDIKGAPRWSFFHGSPTWRGLPLFLAYWGIAGCAAVRFSPRHVKRYCPAPNFKGA